MKNQPERVIDRGAHIVAAGGQDITPLCECEEQEAARLEHMEGMSRERADAFVLNCRKWARRLCDCCPRDSQ